MQRSRRHFLLANGSALGASLMLGGLLAAVHAASMPTPRRLSAGLTNTPQEADQALSAVRAVAARR